jgi:hypothetical protein
LVDREVDGKNIKLDIMVIGNEDGSCMEVAQTYVVWLAFVFIMLSLCFYYWYVSYHPKKTHVASDSISEVAGGNGMCARHLAQLRVMALKDS